MAQKRATPEGRAVYGTSKWIAEAPIGRIKEAMGFRRFSLRGRNPVTGVPGDTGRGPATPPERGPAGRIPANNAFPSGKRPALRLARPSGRHPMASAALLRRRLLGAAGESTHIVDLLDPGRKILASQPFSVLLGAELLALSSGEAEIRVPRPSRVPSATALSSSGSDGVQGMVCRASHAAESSTSVVS